MPMQYRDLPISSADLQDTYGITGTNPKPIDTKVSAPPQSSSSSSSSSSFSLSRILRRKERRASSQSTSHPPSSDTDTSSGRASVDSQRTMTAAAPSKSAPKDYEQAFGALSSSYGFGGSSVVPVPIQPTPPTCSSSSPRSSATTHRRTETEVLDERTANLGSLLTQYGVGSGPSPCGARDSR